MHLPNGKALWWTWSVSVVVLALVLMSATTARSGKLTGPDLIVRSDVLSHQWVVRDENLSSTLCSVQEGEVTPGLRRLIRFTVMTPNVGDTDIALGDPNAHVAANDGLYEFATCHQHYHFRHYAKYELIDPATGFVWRAAKRGFCMLDTDPTRRFSDSRRAIRVFAAAAPSACQAIRASAPDGPTPNRSSSAANTSCSTAATASRKSRRAPTSSGSR